MTDIRQSEQYINYLRKYNWTIEKIGGWNIFIKKFPIIGSLIKIQRVSPPISFEEIENLKKKYRAFKVIIEQDVIARTPMQHRKTKQSPIPSGYKICRSPFLPTKTLILDISKPEKEIFDSFPKEKRRLLDKIIENNEITIKEGTAEDFIKLKSRGLLEKHILPFGVKKEITSLCQSFSPEKIKILVAYPSCPHGSSCPPPVAAALFLFHDKKVYYWQAVGLKKGKKLSAPSLLVWEGIKLAKKKNCEIFDFEGIFDERFPIDSWKGFTHFKKEFGGNEILFPEPITK